MDSLQNKSLTREPIKSYQRINTPLEPESIQRVAQVAEKLLALGFVIITARFGDRPAITVKATVATRLLASAYTGQHRGNDDRMYNSYAAVVDGVKVVWHRRPKRMATILPWRGTR